MNLYDILADVYEEIFPTDPNRVGFCAKLLPNPWSAALDAGCGTAGLSRALAAEGFGAVAFDPDSAMIAKAESAAAREGVAVELHVAGMLETEKVAAGRSFQLITCLGNTLVHLESTEEVEDFARQAAGIASQASGESPAGTLVVQILNYDRILAERPPTLPPITSGAYRFERGYEYLDGEIRFYGTLVDVESGRSWTGETTIRPFRRAGIHSILARHFRRVDCLADYSGTLADDDSFALIFVAGGGSHGRPE